MSERVCETVHRRPEKAPIKLLLLAIVRKKSHNRAVTSAERPGLKSQLGHLLRYHTGEINSSVTQFLSLEGERQYPARESEWKPGIWATWQDAPHPQDAGSYRFPRQGMDGDIFPSQNTHEHPSYKTSPTVPTGPAKLSAS